jgi:predicted acyltransferase (DUF342 family)
VRVTGTSDIAGSVTAATDARFDGTATVGGSVIAGDDAVFLHDATIGGSVSAGGDADFHGDAAVTGDVSAGADADFRGNAVVGGSVSASEDVTFEGTARVGGDVTAGLDAEFLAAAEIGGSVSAGDDADFFDTALVGGGVSAGDDAAFHGAATIGAGVTTGGDIEFFSTANVTGDVIAGDDVDFFASSIVSGAVTAVDDATFWGSTDVGGSTVAGGDLFFDADATIGGSAIAGDDLDFLGDATVGGDVIAVDDITVHGRTDIGGDVTGGDDVVFLDVATIGGSVTGADDVEFLADADVRGDVVSGDDVVFRGLATLGGDVRAADNVTFDRLLTLDGIGDQRLEAGGVLRAQDVVRKTTGGALTFAAADRIIFTGSLVEAIDDVYLNPEGRGAVPDAATIIARRPLTIRSSAGAVEMGVNEKLTVLGALQITAADHVVLGDVSTLGDMGVSAPLIYLRRRAGGPVLTSSGGLTFDGGVDYVAGGRFIFSTRPHFIGAGADPLFGSGIADPDALGTLLGVRFRVISPFDTSLFRFDDTFLDLVADGPTASPLATAFAEDPGAPREGGLGDPFALSPAAQADLNRLGLQLLPVTTAELLDRPGIVFDDLRLDLAPPTAPTPISTSRLEPGAVRSALDRYRAIVSDAWAPMQQALTDAWTAYRDAVPEPDGAGFRDFVESDPAFADARRGLDDLRLLFAELRLTGASPAELSVSRQAVLGPLAPADMPVEQLRDAIDA